MSALAKRFEGTPAGDFWTVYAELERGQSPFYIELGKRHGLAPRALRTGMKAALSVEAASLFPTWFVGMLATATERYLLFLKSTRMPTERPDQVAMRYVIRQEAAPVNALKIASEGDFKAATDVLYQGARSLTHAGDSQADENLIRRCRHMEVCDGGSDWGSI